MAAGDPAVQSVTWDTLALAGLRTAQNEKDPIDYVGATWLQFYKLLVKNGRVRPYGGPQDEHAHQFISTLASEAITEFMPDEVIAGNLGTTANNPLTKMSATFVGRTQNVNFAQGVRGLSRPAYALARVKNDLTQLADNLERKLLIGNTTVATVTANDPFLADTSWATRQFMSLKSLYHSAVDASATGANLSGGVDNGANKWQGVITDDYNGTFVDGSARAQPLFYVTSTVDGTNILDDIDIARARARWGGRSTHLLTSLAKYQQIHQKHVAKTALPTVAGSNLGMQPESFMYGDMEVCWMRDFTTDTDWDLRVAATAIHPVFGLNMPAYNVFTQTTPGQSVGMKDRGFDWLSYLNDVDGAETHAAATAMYRRIEGYLTVMFGAPRGSLFQIIGYT